MKPLNCPEASTPEPGGAAGFPVFVAGGRTYSSTHVIRAADFRGALRAFRETSLTRALRAAPPDGADDAAVGEIGNDYRYRRDLTTAEECEHWLAGRGLSVADFQAWCERVYWEGRPGNSGTPAAPPPSLSPGEIDLCFLADLVLSDDFDRLARELAWRVALECASSAGGAAASGSPELADWDGHLKRLEEAYAACSRGLTTPTNQARCLAELRLPLTRFELEVVQLDGEAAGREAFLCVTQDGLALAAVAEQAGYALSRSEALLEDFPAAWQDRLLSACVGTVPPPFGEGEARYVCQVRNKIEATLDRAEVRERVNRTLLHRHFRELESQHIRWLIPVAAPA
jgi:hypothetical protein